MKKKNKSGFTLIEMLVVVLIIGILAGIALPQYQMAVTKAKVASILPLMRRWKDALAEYKLQHGYFCIDIDDTDCPDGSDLGVNWPSDWNGGECGNSIGCGNDYWYCIGSALDFGVVSCSHDFDDGSSYRVVMYQPDDPNFNELRGLVTCECDGEGTQSEKICKALGGKLVDGYDAVYKLN